MKIKSILKSKSKLLKRLDKIILSSGKIDHTVERGGDMGYQTKIAVFKHIEGFSKFLKENQHSVQYLGDGDSLRILKDGSRIYIMRWTFGGSTTTWIGYLSKVHKPT